MDGWMDQHTAFSSQLRRVSWSCCKSMEIKLVNKKYKQEILHYVRKNNNQVALCQLKKHRSDAAQPAKRRGGGHKRSGARRKTID